MYLISILLYVSLVINTSDNLSINNIDFLNWKKETIELCNQECNLLNDDFYFKECNYLKEDIQSINTIRIDSFYKQAVIYANHESNEIELKYYIHYIFRGEVNNVYYFYVFEDPCGKFIVVRFNLVSDVVEVRRHKRIGKKILRPKSDIQKNSGYDDHLSIISEFKGSEIVSNKVIFLPDERFYGKLMGL